MDVIESVASPTPFQPAPASPCAVSIHAEVATCDIPTTVRDLASFRSWAHSNSFPSEGKVSFLNGIIWVDLSVEEILTHNLVKTELTIALGSIVRGDQLGYLLSDGVLLTNIKANLSTEPDLSFCSWDTVREGRAKFVPAASTKGFRELEGSPDLVIEIVSESSVKKDTETLPGLYWKAEIPEFWLIDARQPPLRFEIFRRNPERYEVQPNSEKGVFSPLFSTFVRIIEGKDPLGHQSFRVITEKA